jgi:hypothetical protein
MAAAEQFALTITAPGATHSYVVASSEEERDARSRTHTHAAHPYTDLLTVAHLLFESWNREDARAFAGLFTPPRSM